MNILIDPRVNGHLFLEDLIDRLDNDQPIVELFNVIYMTVSKTWKSSVLGLQMLTLKHCPQDLETALITGIKNSKQIALGLYIHRLTGSKEAVITLWKSGHTISPNSKRFIRACFGCINSF